MDLASATTVPSLRKSDLDEIPVALPPWAEQERIASKIETLLESVSGSRDHLAKVPKILKAFRQSVLVAACSGRLTEEWRENHRNVQSGADLLSEIKKARKATAQNTKERNQIDEAFEDQMLVVQEDELGFEDVPESWVGCRVGSIGTVVNGSTPSRKRTDYWQGNIPWVSSGEVRNNVITTTRERITKAGYESCSVRMLPKGTVLIAMIGEGKTRGQSSILGIEAAINQNIAAVILSHGLLHPEYLWRWFHFQYEANREYGGGTGPQALNCQRVRELPFLLPPLNEQHEIVRRVEILFKLADKVEKRVEAATKRAEKLTQAILAKAFRGELVPTEVELARKEGRDYEPASVLLERIKSEREEAAAVSTNGTGRHRRPAKSGKR